VCIGNSDEWASCIRPCSCTSAVAVAASNGVQAAAIISKPKVPLSTAVLLLLLLLLLLLWFELQQHHEAHIVPQVKLVEVQLINSSSLKAAGTPAGTVNHNSATKLISQYAHAQHKISVPSASQQLAPASTRKHNSTPKLFSQHAHEVPAHHLLQQHREAHIVSKVKLVEVQLVNGSSFKAAGPPAGSEERFESVKYIIPAKGSQSTASGRGNNRTRSLVSLHLYNKTCQPADAKQRKQATLVEADLVNSSSLKAAGTPASTVNHNSATKLVSQYAHAHTRYLCHQRHSSWRACKHKRTQQHTKAVQSACSWGASTPSAAAAP
jgi:hypothetical protein